MIRRPPRSTLFPTRRSSDLAREMPCHRVAHDAEAQERELLGLRSEEHTSELQSHSDLVCRLLLEKKKQDRTDQDAQTATGGTSPDAAVCDCYQGPPQ